MRLNFFFTGDLNFIKRWEELRAFHEVKEIPFLSSIEQ